MSWDYAWKLGPKGGTLVDMDDYCRAVLLAGGEEPIGAKRGGNVTVGYRHGALPIAHKFNEELLIPLQVSYRHTNAAGAVTHADGREGHAWENKGTIERLLFGKKGLATLRRTTPEWGTIEAYVEPIDPGQQANMFTYVYMLNAPEGFWRSTTQTTDSATPVAVGGNGPVTDAVIDIVGGTDVVVTMTDDGATISISGATPTGGVRVDLTGDNLPVTKITGGADYHEFVSFNRPYRVILEPGDNAFSTSGSPTSVTFKWYDKVR